MRDKVFFSISEGERNLLYKEISSKITPLDVKEQSTIFFSTNCNAVVSWDEWETSLESYGVTSFSFDSLPSDDGITIGSLCETGTSLDAMCHSMADMADKMSKGISSELEDFILYVKNAIFYYKNKKESGGNEIESLSLYSSAKSFIEFMRYVPAFYNKPGIKVYIDDRTGFFGVIYKRTSVKAGTLNILVKDNYEIDFSFAKRRKGVVTITGVAKFGKQLENSDQIRSIFRLME